MTSKHPIRAMLPNEKGSDYFVGDIHGHFGRLQCALDEIGFNENKDRLIAVGDLIDRGPESHHAIEWLNKPWFHSIRGNHEDLYLEWRHLKDDEFEQRHYEEECYKKNGGIWMNLLDEAGHQQLEEAILKLPYFLLVPAGARMIGVVHAEPPENFQWPEVLNKPFSEEWVFPMTWGRKSWKSWKSQSEHETWIKGLDALVVGHAPVPSPQVWGNLLFLDTGGWRRKGRFFIVSSKNVLEWMDGISSPPELEDDSD